MGASLRELRRALSGEVGSSGPLDELAAALGRGAVPRAWAALHPPSQKPLGAWWAWLLRRHRQYTSWVEARPWPGCSLVHVLELWLTSVNGRAACLSFVLYWCILPAFGM